MPMSRIYPSTRPTGATLPSYHSTIDGSLANSMGLSPSREASSCATTQKVPDILWNPKGLLPWPQEADRLCGLEIRVPGYRSRGPG
jgi:hypothetical protein